MSAGGDRLADGGRALPDTAVAVDVVVITRNQAWNVSQLLRTVLDGTAGLDGSHVTLVDSASADETVALACAHEVEVIRLAADQRLTAAAGRHVGLRRGSSPFVLFLDGDMQLVPGWLEAALSVMGRHEDVAAATGVIVDVPREGSSGTRGTLAVGPHEAALTELRHGRGAALYRRELLDRVGGFNPYLYSDEEPELCLRLRSAGFRIVRVEAPIALHLVDDGGGISTILARRRRRLYLGAGQNLRYLLGRETFWPYVRERGFGLVTAAALAAWIAGLALAAVLGHPLAAGAVLLAPAVLFALAAVRKRSIRAAAQSVVMRLVTLDGTIRGFLQPRLDPATHPIRFEVVRHER
jgi:GT2 family glycosyltransferase